jgi:hypothetical protein
MGRAMHWPQVGAQHLRLFDRILNEQRATVADVG